MRIAVSASTAAAACLICAAKPQGSPYGRPYGSPYGSP